MSDHEKALSRSTDPWSSQEVEEFDARTDLQGMIVLYLRGLSGCGYAADFEITEAMLPFFPEVYEGQIRRVMRSLRDKNPNVRTVKRHVHRHRNPSTGQWQQCHTMKPAVRYIKRRKS